MVPISPRQGLVPPATTTATTPAAPKAAAAPTAGLLNIQLGGGLVGQGPIKPGTVWSGTIGVSVVDVLGPWTSTVSLSPFRGARTQTTVQPVAYYSAPESMCTLLLSKSPAVNRKPLGPAAVDAKSGGGVACVTSWTATVDILVPDSNLLADTYSATLTHSIY